MNIGRKLRNLLQLFLESCTFSWVSCMCVHEMSKISSNWSKILFWTCACPPQNVKHSVSAGTSARPHHWFSSFTRSALLKLLRKIPPEEFVSCQNIRAEWSKQARCCRRFADVFFSWQGVEIASLYGLICRCLRRGGPDCAVDLQMFIRGTVPGNTCFFFTDVYSWHSAGECLVYLQMFIRGTVPENAWFICRCLFVARCREIPGLFADVYSWHGAGKYLIYLQMFICGMPPGNAWLICRCLFVARCREIPGLFADVYLWHGAGKCLVYL